MKTVVIIALEASEFSAKESTRTYSVLEQSEVHLTIDLGFGVKRHIRTDALHLPIVRVRENVVSGEIVCHPSKQKMCNSILVYFMEARATEVIPDNSARTEILEMINTLSKK